MDNELRDHLTGMETRLLAEMHASEQRTVHLLTTKIESTETRLLSEFHKWAQTYEVRARGVTARTAEFEERLGIMEERLSDVERRLPRPPQ